MTAPLAARTDPSSPSAAPPCPAASAPDGRRARFEPVAPSRWGSTWRWLAAVGASLVATVVMVADTSYSTTDLTLDVALVVVAFATILVRRRWPLAAGLVACATAGVTFVGMGAVLITVISVASRRRWREHVAMGVAWTLSTGLYDLMTPSADDNLPWWGLLLGSLLFFGIALAVGSFIGARRELEATLRARAETAEREQSARVDRARAEERTRIAREMHDVLAHRISLVAMHSGALAYRTDLTREETAEAAGIIRDNANLALLELREVLGVLRGGASPAPHEAPERPQPRLGDVRELVAAARTAGTTVALDLPPEVEEALPGLGGSVSRAAYRIVQEALTNTRKHAPGMPVDVSVGRTPAPVAGDPDRLTIEVLNVLPAARPSTTRRRGADVPPESGLGLTGLAERASLAGGELRHGPDRSGRYVVAAWLPWL